MVQGERAVPLDGGLVPDTLTPELVGSILNGESVRPRARGVSPSSKPKKRKGTVGKKKSA